MVQCMQDVQAFLYNLHKGQALKLTLSGNARHRGSAMPATKRPSFIVVSMQVVE